MKNRISYKERSKKIGKDKPVLAIFPKDGLFYANVKGLYSIINENL